MRGSEGVTQGRRKGLLPPPASPGATAEFRSRAFADPDPPERTISPPPSQRLGKRQARIRSSQRPRAPHSQPRKLDRDPTRRCSISWSEHHLPDKRCGGHGRPFRNAGFDCCIAALSRMNDEPSKAECVCVMIHLSGGGLGLQIPKCRRRTLGDFQLPDQAGCTFWLGS